MKTLKVLPLMLLFGISVIVDSHLYAQQLPDGWTQKETWDDFYCINKSGQFFGAANCSSGGDISSCAEFSELISHKVRLSGAAVQGYGYKDKIFKYPKNSTLAAGLNKLQGIYFIDTAVGFAFGQGTVNINGNSYPVGNNIWKSTDGGISYSQLNSPIKDTFSPNNYIYRVLEINRDTLFFISNIFAPKGAMIARTYNGGTQLSKINLPEHFVAQNVHFMNGKLGVISGHYDTSTSVPELLITTDGGNSFQSVVANIPYPGFNMVTYTKFLNENYLLVSIATSPSSGTSFISYVSRNKGLTFTELLNYKRVYEAFDTLTIVGTVDAVSELRISFDGFKTVRNIGQIWAQNYKLIRSNEIVYLYGDNLSTSGSSQPFKIFQYKFEPFKVVNIEAYANVIPNQLNPLNLHRKGSPFRFKLKMKNADQMNYLTLKGTLRSLDPGMPVTDSTSTFNNLLKNTDVLSGDEYEIMLNNKTIDALAKLPMIYLQPNFELILSDQFSELPVKKVLLTLNFNPIKDTSNFQQALVDDDSNPDSQGDNDGIIEKAETIELLPQFASVGFGGVNEMKGKLSSPIVSIDIWNNRNGATGIVKNEYAFNWTYQPPNTLIGRPVEDYVFTYKLNNTYKVPFEMLFTGSVRFTQLEDIVTAPPYPTNFNVRWIEGFELNKTFPEIPFIAVSRPQLNEVFMIDQSNKIKWTTNYTGTLRIDYSINSGNNWSNITSNVNAQLLEYVWTPASTLSPAQSVLIRIVIESDTSIANLSNPFKLDKINALNVPKAKRLSFNLYPNPSTGIFVLENNSNEYCLVQVFDMCGKLVDSFSTQANNNKRLDYSLLKSGLYLLHVKSESGVKNLKLMIEK
ncbi:MAG: T9SS type A sorting domain-containing protein [Bacteroidota bacterium]|nr:T9SS type A sorting domain-containing protein [Bacteroidota bacterium]